MIAAFKNPRTGATTAAPRVVPVHFWPQPLPVKRLPGGHSIPLMPSRGRFPCGIAARHPVRVTHRPADVTCRRCVASGLVQALLAAGETAAAFPDAALDAWNLRR